ncbi:hypothetical protein DY000_02039632 [Brassica cretica]|uniref:FBD domain-containing protein n=1 Tax=Brassica cretica TaxID=69181 RepID=A0ABQ7BAC3_BRACR|nr:hypothetical protein DY000_02039632 [Brassica cretica]
MVNSFQVFEPHKLSNQKRFQIGNDINSNLVLSFDQFLKHSKGFDHLEKSLELGLQQPVFCARKSFDSFAFKENGFDLSFHKHELITGDFFASTCALDELMIFKTLLEQKSPRVETDFCDSVLKLDILCFETDRPWHVLRSLLNNCVLLSFYDIVVYNTFFEKHIEPLISDSQSELTLLCYDFEKDRHVLKMFSIMLCLDTIPVCNVYFDVNFERLKRVLHVLGKETLISYLSKYMSCTYDPRILVSVLSVQDKQINGEHTDLKPADETEDELKQSVDELEPAEESMHELKPTKVRVDELDELNELTDTTLELSELSDTEDGAGLAAGRNGPCSA